DAELSESVPISTSLEPEQVDSRATDSLTGGFDADLRELPPSSPSLGSELHANDDETSNLVVDDSVDA
ncbi:SpoIIE-like protein phosphatase domain protein, partial [Trifolium medium]|nr:SpoIIE-like protein phosphatase domain protein [Trifolium medium]